MNLELLHAEPTCSGSTGLFAIEDHDSQMDVDGGTLWCHLWADHCHYIAEVTRNTCSAVPVNLLTPDSTLFCTLAKLVQRVTR